MAVVAEVFMPAVAAMSGESGLPAWWQTYFIAFLSLPRRSATATINIGMKPSGKNSGPRFVSTLTVGIFYLEDLK